MDEIRQFPAEPSSVALARRFVREGLGPLEADTIEDAVLLVGEIAANVVEHARTEFDVKVALHGSWARVEVADGSAVLPAVRDLADDANRGRGLLMVQRLAAAWGVQERPTGKCVWFEVRDKPGPRPASPPDGAR